MENRANYALIGAFVLIVSAAVVGFVLWLSNAQLNTAYDEYEVSFVGPVRGLSAGGEVRFNGLKVGEVLGLRLDENDANTVLADIQILARTPVDTKSTARLEPLGLTGLNYIQILSGGEQYGLMRDLPSDGARRITGEGSQIESLLDGGGSVVEAAQKALNRVNAVMSAEAIEDFHGILANIRQITGDVDASEFDMAKVNEMIDNFSEASDAVSIAATSLALTSTTVGEVAKADFKSLLNRAEVSLEKVDGAVGSFGGVADGADDLIVDARDAINRLSNSGLTDLEETVDAIRRLVTTLGRVADSLEQSPANFLVGAEKDEMVLPQ